MIMTYDIVFPEGKESKYPLLSLSNNYLCNVQTYPVGWLDLLLQTSSQWQSG